MLSKQDLQKGGYSHTNSETMPPIHNHDISYEALGERRVGIAPIPADITKYLNSEQQNTLQIMRYFGWELAFIRRSDIDNIIPVICHAQSTNTEYATLEKDGDIIRSPDIAIRH